MTDTLELSLEEDLYLMHYGIKGMRWGKRRTDAQLDAAAAKKPKSGLDMTDKEKSGHRVRLEAKYLKKGMTREEASVATDKRIKTEKILAIAGAVVVGAAVGYAVKEDIGKRFVGVTLEKGKDLHYVNALGDKASLDRRLYTSFDKNDTKKYKGMLASALRKNAADTTIYDTVLTTKESIKAPSQFQAARLYNQFLKDNNLPKAGSKSYKEFNKDVLLDVGSPNANKFMDFMRGKGYNSVLDYNDQFVSGYNTKKPLILFNAKSSVNKTGQSIVEKAVSDKLGKQQVNRLLLKGAAKTVGLGAAYVGGVTALNTHKKNAVVQQYLNDHPETKKTRAELYRDLRVGMDGIVKVPEGS